MNCPRCNAPTIGDEIKCFECGYILGEVTITGFSEPVFLKDATVEQLREELRRKQEMAIREEIMAIISCALTKLQNGEELDTVMGNMHNDLHKVAWLKF